MVVATVGAMVWLGLAILRSPEAKDSLAWAVRSWIFPPDAEAGWQQGPG